MTVCIYVSMCIHCIHPLVYVIHTRSIYEKKMQKSQLDMFLWLLERNLILFYKSGTTIEVIIKALEQHDQIFKL